MTPPIEAENYSKLELLAFLSDSEKRDFFQSLSNAEADGLAYNWAINGRPKQFLPQGDWTHWLVLAGRGFGKTRVGSEAVRQWCEIYPIIHLVGPTTKSVRDVMIQGESGLLSCFPPHERPTYEPSKGLVTFHNGSKALTFSGDEPERLRGPQCYAYWFDELLACQYAEAAWDNLMFGFRLGDQPRGLITTTPKPTKLLRGIMEDKKTVITRGSSYENRTNLASSFFDNIIRKYEGTRLGRQELMAEILDDVPGALWSLAMIDATRLRGIVPVDELVRIVVAVDPAVSTALDSADTGIVVAGLTPNGNVLVLEDLTVHGTPLDWAKVVSAAVKRWRADTVCGERNNGGDLVEGNLHGYDPTIPYRDVWASRGKAIRAQPVAMLYERGLVHHVGVLPELEGQMCSFIPGAPREGERLDRMDALVWAITELCIDVDETPQVFSAVSRVSISRY